MGLAGAAAPARASKLLTAVGIADAQRRLDEFPFQLSGGMKQRVMIAVALAGNPRLLIADEPTTALDVTIQAQILDLLRRLQAERGMGMLLITHDLGVVAQMAHRVGVMYAGEIVEEAPRDTFFATPLHPYTQKLFAALPDLRGAAGGWKRLPGRCRRCQPCRRGCRFAERCPHAWARCRDESPGWHEAGENHRVRCHLLAEPGRAVAALRDADAGCAWFNRHSGFAPRSLQVDDLLSISRSGAASCSARSGRCGRSMASPWSWRAAARWRWSASRVAARPRSARPSCS